MDAYTWDQKTLFQFEGKIYRFATSEEIAERPEGHVYMACECGTCMWTCKGLAVNDGGRYTGARNIFYLGEEPECYCPASKLAMVVEADWS